MLTPWFRYTRKRKENEAGMQQQEIANQYFELLMPGWR
jgi:hypothetical protein